MAAPKEAWGINVGQVALKAIKIRELGDKVEAVAYEYIEHPKVLSHAGEDRDQLIRSAIQKFLSRNPISDTPVAISVPGHHTLARFTKLPPVDEKKVPDIVRYEAEQQIPFDLDEVMWDYQIFRGESSAELEVGIFAMKRDLIATHVGPFIAAGIEPSSVQSSPLALFNALVYDGIARVSDENAGEGTVMLDVGAVNSDLVIGAGNGLWTRTIQIGGNSFTEALVKVFKLSFSKAENLKRTAPTSKYARQVFQAMRPVFADLVAEVQRSLGFYGSTRREVKVVRLIGMGGAFKMPGLQKFVQQNLGIEVVKPESFAKLVPSAGSPPQAFQDNLLSFGVAYGLALQGLDRARVTSNLLPAEITRQRSWRKKQPFFAAAAACLLLAAGIIWARLFIDQSTLATNIGDEPRPQTMTYAQAKQLYQSGVRDKPARSYAAEWVSIAQAFDAELKKKKAEEEKLQERLDRYNTLEKHKNTWLDILDAIHRALPAPDAPVDQADSTERYAELAAQVPRTERKSIYIDEFDSQYDAQKDIIGMLIGELGEEAGDFVYSDKFVPPGFKLRLKMRSLNKDSKFIDNTFIKNLKEFSRQSEGPFYFDFITVTDRRQIRGSTSLDYVIGNSKAAQGQNQSQSMVDPVTGESMETDWRLTVVMAVVLSAPPGDVPPEEEQAPEPEAPPPPQEDEERPRL